MLGKLDRTGDFFPPQNYFPLVILLCLISGRAVANHFNEVYITERWAGWFCRACSRATPNQTGISCERGLVVVVEINMACVLSMRSFVFGVRGNIFWCRPKGREESTTKIDFVLITRRLCNSTDTVIAMWKQHFVFYYYYVCVCVWQSSVFSENQQKPVISHVNAGWEANMRISGGNLS